MSKILAKIINWGVVILVGLLPLFFLPITTDFYGFNKNFLLYFFTIFLFIAWMVKIGFDKQIAPVKTGFDLPVFAFGAIWLLATIIVAPNKVEALILPGATGTIIFLTILYFIITQNVSKKNYIFYSFILSSTLLSLIAIYQFMGLGEATSISWLKLKLWTPAESPLILITVLISGLALNILLLLKKLKKNPPLAIIFGLSLLLIIAGLGITIFQVLTTKDAVMILPWPSAWAIAMESFKNSPLLGIGPGNFISAFNRFRPLSFNNYDFWNNRFSSSANYLFQVLTLTGGLGLAAFGWLVWQTVKLIKSKPILSGISGILFSVLLALFFLTPVNLILLFFFFISLAILAPREKEGSKNLPGKFSWLPLILTTPFIAGIIYFSGRAYAAEVYFKNSLNAAEKNQGGQAYNQIIKAITLNPYRSVFRISYSQINLSLANTLAAKKDLSDQEKANISQLVQQAIREGKIATNLNQQDSRSWENLGQIYQNLINFAQGAGRWTIASYQQAVAMDPVSPRLRVELGGILYSLGNNEEAIRQFLNAVNLKPDYANGFYNLALAYEKEEKYDQAHWAMQKAADLTPSTSADYALVQKELQELAKKLETPPTGEKTEAKPEEQLTKPEPLPTAAITPIQLPESEVQPEIPTSPSPFPTP